MGNDVLYDLLDNNNNIEMISVEEGTVRNSLYLIDSSIDEKVKIRFDFDILEESK